MGRRLLNRGMYMYDLVDAELSLLYDFLYTEAPVIYTRQGCCIRVFSPLAMVAAFLLFHLVGKGAYSRVDVAITYVLLVGAIVLEMASVFRVLGSTWTCAYLDDRRMYPINAMIMRLVRAGSKRRWSHSIGQYNVLDYCSRDKNELRGRIARATGLEKWWKKAHFSSNIPITMKFMQLVVEQIVVTMRDYLGRDIMDARGRAVLTNRGIFNDISWSVEGSNLAECILRWHVATNIYLYRWNNHQEEEHLVKAIEVPSNYMVFLLLVRPNSLPGGAQYNLRESLEDRVAGDNQFTHQLEDRTPEEIVRFLYGRYAGNDDHGDHTCRWSVLLASKLLGNEWDLPNMRQVIFAVWVEFLCYAAHHSTDVYHCGHLGSGGDFLTVICLVVDHNRLFQAKEDAGFIR